MKIIDPPYGARVRILDVKAIEFAEGIFENGEETIIVQWSESPALLINNHEQKKHLFDDDRLFITRDEYHAIEILEEELDERQHTCNG